MSLDARDELGSAAFLDTTRICGWLSLIPLNVVEARQDKGKVVNIEQCSVYAPLAAEVDAGYRCAVSQNPPGL